MKRILSLIIFVVILSYASSAFAVPGVTDRVLGASLIVPYFETGIDAAANPQDTLLVVSESDLTSGTIHYHVWDIDGNPTGIQGNIVLTQGKSWPASMRDLISSASSSDKTMLTDGDFYLGFVTIDHVTSATTKNPTESTYPFGSVNGLHGYIYYTRLTQGSANGLAMVPLEHVSSTVDAALQDFYDNNDNREEIDSDARACADQLVSGTPCTGGGDNDIDKILARIFKSPGLNGKTKVIIFLWSPNSPPISVLCDPIPGVCDSEYTYRRHDESGTIKEDTTIRLDHVVNVIDVAGTDNGYVAIWNVPSGVANYQIYAFSINAASPASISANWDAIFEAFIDE
jgi:hypothetical protein